MGFMDRIKNAANDELAKRTKSEPETKKATSKRSSTYAKSTTQKKRSAKQETDLTEEELDFFDEQQRRYDEEQKMYEGLPELKVVNKRAQDALEHMSIPPTFSIPQDLFMPDDLIDVTFSIQSPYGFEQGQVVTFVDRARATVEHYVNLLQERNDHVAKLATMIDKMQIDMNNLKYQHEIAQGINVMTTSDSEDLEGQLMESRLTIKRLEDRIRQIEHTTTVVDSEREKLDAVQDQLSIATREADELREENIRLRLELDDSSDDFPIAPQGRSGGLPAPRQGLGLPGLPRASGAVSGGLPVPAVDNNSLHPSEGEDDIFDIPSEDTFQPVSYLDDDYEDDLDDMLDGWNK